MIDFLKALVRHIDQPLLIIWDGLPAHCSRLVRGFIELSEGHIVTVYLPPYAPELYPVEYIWAYWKQHELPKVCPKDYGDLSRRARRALRRTSTTRAANQHPSKLGSNSAVSLPSFWYRFSLGSASVKLRRSRATRCFVSVSATRVILLALVSTLRMADFLPVSPLCAETIPQLRSWDREHAIEPPSSV